jgi:uncharacterized protein (DUF849 family)
MPRKAVITCALTGSFDTPGKNPAVPVSPEAIAASALDAAQAGAAVVHIHVRDPKTTKPSMELSLYREVVERIRDRNAEVVINLTTGAGGRYAPDPSDPQKPAAGTTLASPAVRVRHVEALKPEICTLDVATLNFGETVFMNTPAHLREMADRIKAAGVKPEIEVFDLGHIELAKRLIADGHLAEPPLFQLCLGIPWGAPATPETMVQMRDRLPSNAVWSGFGIGRAEFPMAVLAAELGGHVRIGLEDNLYLSRGQLAPSNAALVEKAVTLLSLLDVSVATPAEAREIFGLGAAS